jgi:hypothetical protein
MESVNGTEKHLVFVRSLRKIETSERYSNNENNILCQVGLPTMRQVCQA